MNDLFFKILFVGVLLFVWAAVIRAGWYRNILNMGTKSSVAWKKRSQEKNEQFNDSSAKVKELVEKKQKILQNFSSEEVELKRKIEEALVEQNELKEKLAGSHIGLREKAISR